ncbi:hypothetical protein FLJC2902T_25870 [Flavobacterium limnosediminis JC2902]|uniref:Uncharacterized protein n=1 Tax=Flavobacterium limnosediminis JC2902 TaxID=1341181 RepID=V6SIT2_9FLAO|nr:hypothetical protein [Flavobacterium limnosediminis]ESU26613.1 hypothetical protein FLJC2902T_25870 [Flavobacterium limnosediminis JC2902]
MKFKIIVSLFLLASLSAYSQELKYKSGGRIFDSNDKKMSPTEVRELLAKQPGMLQFYNKGRSKKALGNTMLYGGMALLATDFLLAASKESEYPTMMSILGAASMILSIPVKAGYTKKIKTVVKDYNAELSNKDKDSGFNFESMSVVSNKNGVGLRLTF